MTRRIDLENRELKVFKESLLALQTALGGLLAGSIAAFWISVLTAYYWTVMLYPMIISVRGAINGILSGRLSTGLHLKLVSPKLRGNTQYFHAILAALFTTTMFMSILGGFIIFLLSHMFYGVEVYLLLVIVSVAVVSQYATTLITEPLTSFFSFMLYRRGLDPDVVTYPISSTMTDIIATFMYILTLLSIRGGYTWILLLLTVVFISTTIYIAFIFKRDRDYMEVIRETTLTICIVSLLSSIGGVFLSRVRGIIEEKPGIVVVYPALIDTIGDIGASFGSICTTRIILGLIELKIKGVVKLLWEILLITSAAFIMFVLYSILSYVTGGGFLSILAIILTFLLVAPIVIVFSFVMAIVTFRLGLNPDDFVIPLETTFTDTMLTVILSSILYMMIG
ncbi:MAG: magnesium transporter [Nitrososphaerota archaeon]|nr:magnesium transporter [Candidatus Bathyarchaeota archaeon]MCX8162260.1 magnesium transporter [Candidatus Bathyarchaeota archaeon]MDW8062334.1 magnesium transporter [Nitrososphaerota archaeon]